MSYIKAALLLPWLDLCAAFVFGRPCVNLGTWIIGAEWHDDDGALARLAAPSRNRGRTFQAGAGIGTFDLWIRISRTMGPPSSQATARPPCRRSYPLAFWSPEPIVDITVLR